MASRPVTPCWRATGFNWAHEQVRASTGLRAGNCVTLAVLAHDAIDGITSCTQTLLPLNDFSGTHFILPWIGIVFIHAKTRTATISIHLHLCLYRSYTGSYFLIYFTKVDVAWRYVVHVLRCMVCLVVSHGIPIWGNRFTSLIVRLVWGHPYCAIDSVLLAMPGVFIIEKGRGRTKLVISGVSSLQKP